MRRTELPTISVTEAANEVESTERAKRLAFFESTVKENPATFGAIARSLITVEYALKAAQHPDVLEYAKRPDSHATSTFESRAVYVIGQLLRYDDDLEILFDPLTEQAAQTSIGVAESEGEAVLDSDVVQERASARRILRLGAYAAEFAHANTLNRIVESVEDPYSIMREQGNEQEPHHAA